MRPVRLQVSGYTCFKDEVVVDFDHLDLFVISGTTGSGKSSLLDAMTFALFGEVPRSGKHGLADLISLGRERVSVLFDFRIGDTEYRIHRSRRHKGAAQVLLERKEKDEFVPVAEGVREVDPEVQRLLGLGYEAFKQAVVLPQGEFAEFLHCQPAERREMLNDLFRLQVFERMREQAAVKEREHGSARLERERRLNDDYLGATPGAVADLSRQHQELERQSAEAGRQSSEFQERLQSLRRDHEMTRELMSKQEKLKEHEQRTPRIEAMARRAAAAQRAAGVVPILDQAATARKNLDSRNLDLDRAEKNLTGLQETLERTRDEHARAQASAEVLPSLREQVIRLNEAMVKLAKMEGLERQAAELAEALKAQETQRQELSVTLDQITTGLVVLDRERHEATLALAAVGYDAELDQRLEAARDQAVRLKVERARLLKETIAVTASIHASEQAEAAAKIASQLAEEASAIKTTTDQQLEAIRAELQSAQDRHAAAHLRSGLTVGQPCPVCCQAVAQLPTDEPLPVLKQLEKQLSQIEKDQRKTAKDLEEKTSAAASAAARASALLQQAEEGKTRLQQMQDAFGALEAEVTATAGKSLPGTAEIETRVLSAIEIIARKRLEHVHAEKRVQELERKADLLKQNRETRCREVEAAAAAQAQIQDRLTELQGELETVRQEVLAITESADPRAERDRVSQEIDRLTAAVAESARRVAAIETQHAQLAGQVQQLRQTAAEADRQAATTGHAAEEALRQADFPDAEAARAAALSRQEADKLVAAINAHRQDVHALQARIVELLGALGERRVSDQEMETCCREARSAAEHASNLQHNLASVAEQLRSLKEKVERAHKLREELEEHQKQHAIYHRLADDLQSDHFQAYRLEETLTELVRGASAQLSRLTGDRYGLDFVADEILVIDRDNANERRSTDTLSGGETFLASLALALELSDQVQRAVGAVRLDCLFIDEGFGTLDPETLRVVADAVRSLQVGGRMVGIITHIPELKDEFDQRITVVKEAGCSRVTLECE